MSTIKSSVVGRILTIGLLSVSFTAYAYITHEVKRSETLWGLSHKYHVSADDIIAANPKVAKGLQTGMVLRIPEPEDLKKLTEEAKAEKKETMPEVKTLPKEERAPETPVAPVTPVEEETIVDIIGESESGDLDILAPRVEPEKGNKPAEVFEDDSDIVIFETGESEKPSILESDDFYIAKFGDTLKSISVKTGVSEVDLLRYNPMVPTGRIPEGYNVRLNDSAISGVNTSGFSLVDSIVYNVQPQIDVVETTPSRKETTIAVMLPFDADGETVSRQSLLVTDFYKGFLMAVQQATSSGDFPLKIIAIDTQCDSIQFDANLRSLASMGVDVIVPPEDDAQLEKVESYAIDNNMLVFNTLNIKDEGYKRYPNVIQCNINQKLMYDKAISTLLNDFSEYTPVILDLSGGKDEKMSFINELKNQYEAKGRKVINLSFKNKLEQSDLNTLPENGKYIFIPKSGSVDVFNHISEALVNAVEEDFINDRFKVFGYPDWIAYRGEQEEALHRMGANIYSRFYLDANDFSTEDANNEFVKWFGNPMEDVFPSQGILGYDTGKFLLHKLRSKGSRNDARKFEYGTFNGIQSTFHFVREDGSDDTSGLINDSLYIIEYLPGETIYVKTI